MDELTQWWNRCNSIATWLTIAVLLVITVASSNDFSKTYWNFDKLGLNQLIIFGIVTFLLLYKSISKIKIGSVIEIETREAVREGIRGMESLTKSMDNMFIALQPSISEDPKIAEAKIQLIQAKNHISNSKQILDNLDDFIDT
jgi:hypothetical protein